MTLAPHGILGAFVAAKVSQATHPALGLILAFLSHFLLDAIPHWDYLISSLKKARFLSAKELVKNYDFWRDILSITLDLLICLIAVIILFENLPQFPIALAGAFTAILPDLLQFLHWLFPSSHLLQLFKKFHHQFHASKKPKSNFLGFLEQVILVIAVAMMTILWF